jgi:hypothetical protein
MSMKLLPASANSVDSSQAPDVSTSLVPLTQRAITTQAGQISLVPSSDTFSRLSSMRLAQANWIDGTVRGRLTALGVHGWESPRHRIWCAPCS